MIDYNVVTAANGSYVLPGELILLPGVVIELFGRVCMIKTSIRQASLDTFQR